LRWPQRRRRRLGRPATASASSPTTAAPILQSEKMKIERRENRAFCSKGREERERKRKMNENWSCNPFIPLLTRPRLRGSNRPKPNSIGPTRAPVLPLSFYFLHTPIYCLHPSSCIHIFFTRIMFIFSRIFTLIIFFLRRILSLVRLCIFFISLLKHP